MYFMSLPYQTGWHGRNVLGLSVCLFIRPFVCPSVLVMWNDVQLAEHRLQIRASKIRVHTRWLNFNSSTSGPSFIARWSYRIALRVTHAVKKVAKLQHSIHGAEAIWKLKGRPTACAVSHFTHLAWENVTTDFIRGGRVCSYQPRPPTTSAISRRSAE